MTAFHIKVIAIILMLIDHIGLFFFPQFLIFRLIGRLSFPLFAWLIANGAHHTHDITKYLQRLYIFALIAQMPFLLANRLINPTFIDLNVLCTLFFGLSAIVVIQKSNNWAQSLFISVFFIAVAQLLHTDYGGIGVAVIVVFYLFYNNFKKLLIAQLVLFLTPFVFMPGYLAGFFEPVGLLSLLIIYFYNNQPGPRAKYLFYIIYPLQYVVLYFIVQWLYSVI